MSQLLCLQLRWSRSVICGALVVVLMAMATSTLSANGSDPSSKLSLINELASIESALIEQSKLLLRQAEELSGWKKRSEDLAVRLESLQEMLAESQEESESLLAETLTLQEQLKAQRSAYEQLSKSSNRLIRELEDQVLQAQAERDDELSRRLSAERRRLFYVTLTLTVVSFLLGAAAF